MPKTFHIYYLQRREVNNMYEAPTVEIYEEDDAWTFAPCGQD